MSHGETMETIKELVTMKKNPDSETLKWIQQQEDICKKEREQYEKENRHRNMILTAIGKFEEWVDANLDERVAIEMLKNGKLETIRDLVGKYCEKFSE